MTQTLLVILLSLHLTWCQDLQSQARELLSLLAPSPALGEPWPNIPGPDLDNRVCIVGAGATGIHMAMSLKKKNYENVFVMVLFNQFNSISRLWSLRNPGELGGNALV